MPMATASSSISASCTIAHCGTPKPRKAPPIASLVWIARVVQCTAGTRYGPIAWIGTRLPTIGPQDEYGPVLKSAWNS